MIVCASLKKGRSKGGKKSTKTLAAPSVIKRGNCPWLTRAVVHNNYHPGKKIIANCKVTQYSLTDSLDVPYDGDEVLCKSSSFGARTWTWNSNVVSRQALAAAPRLRLELSVVVVFLSSASQSCDTFLDAKCINISSTMTHLWSLAKNRRDSASWKPPFRVIWQRLYTQWSVRNEARGQSPRPRRPR